MSELGKRCLAVAAAAACGLVALTTAPAIAGERGGTQLDRGRLGTAPADYTQYRRNMVYVEPGYRSPAVRTYTPSPYAYPPDNIRDPAGGSYVQRSPSYFGSSGYYYIGGQYVDNIRDPAGGTYLQKPYVYYPSNTWAPMGAGYR